MGRGSSQINRRSQSDVVTTGRPETFVSPRVVAQRAIVGPTGQHHVSPRHRRGYPRKIHAGEMRAGAIRPSIPNRAYRGTQPMTLSWADMRLARWAVDRRKFNRRSQSDVVTTGRPETFVSPRVVCTKTTVGPTGQYHFSPRRRRGYGRNCRIGEIVQSPTAAKSPRQRRGYPRK